MVTEVSARLVGVAYGRRFAVDAPQVALDALRDDLPFSWQEEAPDAAPERVWRIEPGTSGATASVDHEHLSTGANAESLARMVAGDLELWVAEHAEGLVFVHAGAVVVHGVALLLPGRTHAGKSTLVAALVRAGAEYFSDEYAPIDAEGQVHAYRRRPRQRTTSPADGWDVEIPTPSGAPRPVPVGLVATLEYRADTPELAVQDVAAAAGVMSLLGNTVCAVTRPQEALEALSSAIVTARCISGVRGEAERAAEALLERLRPALR